MHGRGDWTNAQAAQLVVLVDYGSCSVNNRFIICLQLSNVSFHRVYLPAGYRMWMMYL